MNRKQFFVLLLVVSVLSVFSIWFGFGIFKGDIYFYNVRSHGLYFNYVAGLFFTFGVPLLLFLGLLFGYFRSKKK
jgi:hypothetical protein